MLRLRLAAPRVLVDLGGIAELRGIREDGDRIAIGAMTTHYDVIRDDLVNAARARCWRQATETVADQPGPPPRHARRLARARRPGR